VCGGGVVAQVRVVGNVYMPAVLQGEKVATCRLQRGESHDMEGHEMPVGRPRRVHANHGSGVRFSAGSMRPGEDATQIMVGQQAARVFTSQRVMPVGCPRKKTLTDGLVASVAGIRDARELLRHRRYSRVQ